MSPAQYAGSEPSSRIAAPGSGGNAPEGARKGVTSNPASLIAKTSQVGEAASVEVASETAASPITWPDATGLSTITPTAAINATTGRRFETRLASIVGPKAA